jgi:hypothetical protein
VLDRLAGFEWDEHNIGHRGWPISRYRVEILGKRFRTVTAYMTRSEMAASPKISATGRRE